MNNLRKLLRRFPIIEILLLAIVILLTINQIYMHRKLKQIRHSIDNCYSHRKNTDIIFFNCDN